MSTFFPSLASNPNKAVTQTVGLFPRLSGPDVFFEVIRAFPLQADGGVWPISRGAPEENHTGCFCRCPQSHVAKAILHKPPASLTIHQQEAPI
jgi:hypothetical protein